MFVDAGKAGKEDAMVAKFVNGSNLEFTRIGGEEARTYVFPGEERVTITAPQWLHVSESGGHRLFAADGVSHYIPAGWIHLYWRAKPGNPNFLG